MPAPAILALMLGGVAATAPLDIDGIAGVYKHRFPNALVSGESFTSEDVLEVVKVSPTAAYVTASTHFFNGHECGVVGVFDLIGPDLVWHDPDPATPGQPPCTLKLHIVKAGLEFDDGEGTCKSQCGARGSWGGEDFPLTARRRIRYMPLILRSPEYREAMAAHAKAK